MEDAIGLFSEELRILDENTVQLMIDEMQETIDRQRAELDARKDELNTRDARIAELEQLFAPKTILIGHPCQTVINPSVHRL